MRARPILGIALAMSACSGSAPEAPPVPATGWLRDAAVVGPFAPDLSFSDASGALRGRASPDGLHVEGGPNDVVLHLVAWGRADRITSVDEVAPALDGDRVAWERPDLTEWWTPAGAGLEQGFDLATRPAGTGPVVLRLGVEGASVVPDGLGARLVATTGAGLRYDGLVAYDADGDELVARMEVDAGEIRLVVDDADARWPLTVDPILATAAWQVDGPLAGADFGERVTYAGDVNGDGYADLLVGQPTYGATQAGEGRAQVFYGSATGLSSTSGWSFEPNQIGAACGQSITAIGDVNKDGYADIAVGAPSMDQPQVDEGVVYVFYGGSTGLPATPSVTLEQNVAGAAFGASLASTDVNADGFGDLIVGAPNYTNVQAGEGAAYVFLGAGSGLPLAPAWKKETDDASAACGSAVAGADLNGDGFGDVVVMEDEDRLVWAYAGQSGGTGPQTVAMTSDFCPGVPPFKLAELGDINGDGTGDLGVGSALADKAPFTDDGTVWMLFGSATGSTGFSSAASFSGGVSGANLGASIAAAGDVNGDGFADVIAGAPGYAAGQVNEGRALVYFGRPTTPVQGFAFESNTVGAFAGRGASGAGDVNGDGFADVVVGAPGFGASGEGRAWAFLGAPALPGPLQTPWDAALAGTLHGYASAPCDVNGDGRDDVIAGAPGWDNPQVNEGRVAVRLGTPTGLSAVDLWTAEPNLASAAWGFAVACAGDTNGDGYEDVLVGGYRYANGLTDEGAFAVYNGSATTPSATPTLVESNVLNLQLGYSVAGIGDVNGDGYADVAASAWNDATTTGSVRVHLGSAAGISTTASSTLVGAQTGERFGERIAGAGDVNGDGYADLLVGSTFYDNPDASEGRAQLFLGGPYGVSSTPAWSAEGNAAAASYGRFVGTAGDVNGDGYADLLVGSEEIDLPFTNAGRLDLYLGAASGPGAVPQWSVAGAAASYMFGHSAASGDLNGDGYADVVVGAWTGAATSRGTLYAYLGGPAGLASAPAWTNASLVNSDQQGVSVGIGDLNGDGFGDIFAGGGQNANGQVRSFLGGTADTNLGPAFAWSPHAERTSTTVPVAAYGRAFGTQFDVDGVARSAAGRTRARWQVEVDARGTSFDGKGLTSASSYVDTLTSGAPASTPIIGLAQGTAYHWRARLRQDPARAYPHAARWITGGWDGQPSQVHLRTSCTSDFDNDLSCDAVDLDDDNDGDPDTLDCAPNDKARFTGAPEIVGDKVDQDCDTVDSCYRDTDKDTFGSTVVVDGDDLLCDDKTSAVSSKNTDCDDANAAIYPAAPTVVDNGINEDCAGGDECYRDSDLDKYGSTTVMSSADLDCLDAGESGNSFDCKDAVPTTYPGAPALVGDGVDQDCLGGDECYQDVDGDKYGGFTIVQSTDLDCTDPGESTFSTDCATTDPLRFPGAPEVVADKVDQNCDTVDSCYTDADNDNHGTVVVRVDTNLDCTDASALTSAVSDDCDDTKVTRYPGAPPVIGDGLDQDCTLGDECYRDVDLDTYGTSAVLQSADLDCTDAGESKFSTDCNDAANAISPGVAEIVADKIDQNCDLVDSCYKDGDNDEHGSTLVIKDTNLDCSDTTALTSAVSDDCDDTKVTRYPGAAPIIGDGLDQNCNLGDECYPDVDLDGFGGGAFIDSADVDCTDPGESSTATDCGPTDNAIYPGAAEVTADGVDQSCDGREVCYKDADDDGHGTTTLLLDTNIDCADATALTSYVSDDCDDLNSATFKGAVEIPSDLVDEDCDGVETCFADFDGDGFGTGVIVGTDLDCLDAPEVLLGTDCNDGDASVNPTVGEIVADGIDQNCDGVDRCYVDGDADGYGTAATADDDDRDCGNGTAGVAAVVGDCDDTNGTRSPGAVPILGDGLDQDCVGADECGIDLDGDGVGDGVANSVDLDCTDAGEASADGDCDDADPLLYPGHVETPADGVDQDCDAVDACFEDLDGDGYGSNWAVVGTDLLCDGVGESKLPDDCDDVDAFVGPDAREACNLVDDDCDGSIDEDGACDCTVIAYEHSSYAFCSVRPVDWDDAEADCAATGGHLVEIGDADEQAFVASAAMHWWVGADAASSFESWAQDEPDGSGSCVASTPSGWVDEDCGMLSAYVCETELPCAILDWYVDLDGDGFGDPASTPVASCDRPSRSASNADDCDDTAYTVHVGAPERCNDVDDDCDGAKDDEVPTQTWYVDADGDGHGTSSATLEQCGEPVGYAAANDDCDDANRHIFTGAPETCDRVDQDCDGKIDEGLDVTWYPDVDGDGVGDEAAAVVNCEPPEGFIVVGGDCDDADSGAFPGAAEQVDAIDQDCDGYVDPKTDLVVRGGCACDAGGSGTGLAAFGLLAAMFVRRRRAS